MKALQSKNWVYVINILLEISTEQLDISYFSNPNEISILSQLSENLHICKEYYNSIYHNVAGCFQEYLIRLPDLFVEKMEDDININLFSNIDLKNEQDPAEIFKNFDAFFYKFGRLPAVEKLTVIPRGSTPSFVKTDNILSPFDAINELNKSINNLLMDKANKFINQKNQRLSFNSVNDFKSKNKKIEEDIVDNILNGFTIEHLQESDHLFHPNTADEINKQIQDEEEQKRRLDIVLNERQCEIEKGMIFDAKKNLLKTLAGIDGNISSSVVYLSDLNIGKMETNVK